MESRISPRQRLEQRTVNQTCPASGNSIAVKGDCMAASRTVWQGMSLIDISIVISAIGILVLGVQRWV